MTVHVNVLKGCPGSGKSTFAQQLCGLGWKRINNDDLRKLIDFSVWSPDNEAVIKTATELLLTEFVKSGFNVVIDNVHAGKQHFDKYYRILERLNISCQLEELPFYVDLETAIARDAERTGTARVGKEVVTKWWKKLGGESFRTYVPRKVEFKKMEPVTVDPSRPRCVIVDIDGTVAHCEGVRSPYDFSKVHLDRRDDTVIEVIQYYVEYCENYSCSEQTWVLFVSGRSDECREQTTEWLNRNYGSNYAELLMRKEGDNRPDFIVKREILERDILPNWCPVLVLDDRPIVCRMWRWSGLKCLQVNDKEF